MKKSSFLLCFLPFSFSFFNNNISNNKKFNVNSRFYTVQSDFNTYLRNDTLGWFHSYSDSTGWKILISRFDLQDNVSKYKHFSLIDVLYFSLFLLPESGLPPTRKYYIDNQFETSKYLINNTITSKEFYFDGNDADGYYQAKITYYFKLEDNKLFFKISNYSYAGWCVYYQALDSSSTLKENSILEFF